ncbi:MAG: DUF4411 family protein [Candidatus Thorarchaeota archaeon]
MKYSFDTSAFINPWKHFYTPRRFPKLWSIIDRLIQEREVVATEMVYHELNVEKDDLLLWVRARKKKMFVLVDKEQQAIQKQIQTDFPDFVDHHSMRDRADSFVVALAMQHKLIVVTDEKRPRKGRVKIPDVCDHYDVRCIDFQTFQDEIGYTDS